MVKDLAEFKLIDPSVLIIYNEIDLEDDMGGGEIDQDGEHYKGHGRFRLIKGNQYKIYNNCTKNK